MKKILSIILSFCIFSITSFSQEFKQLDDAYRNLQREICLNKNRIDVYGESFQKYYKQYLTNHKLVCEKNEVKYLKQFLNVLFDLRHRNIVFHDREERDIDRLSFRQDRIFSIHFSTANFIPDHMQLLFSRRDIHLLRFTIGDSKIISKGKINNIINKCNNAELKEKLKSIPDFKIVHHNEEEKNNDKDIILRLERFSSRLIEDKYKKDFRLIKKSKDLDHLLAIYDVLDLNKLSRENILAIAEFSNSKIAIDSLKKVDTTTVIIDDTIGATSLNLLRALKENNIELAKKLLKSGVNPNEACIKYDVAAHYKKEGYVHNPMDRYISLLEYALYEKNYEMFEELLKHGADPFVKRKIDERLNSSTYTYSCIGCDDKYSGDEHRLLDCVGNYRSDKKMREIFRPYIVKAIEQQKTLEKAITDNDINIVKKCLEAGADQNIKIENFYFWENGWNVKYSDINLLEYAVYNNKKVEIIELLLKHGADPFVKRYVYEKKCEYCNSFISFESKYHSLYDCVRNNYDWKKIRNLFEKYCNNKKSSTN